MEIANLSRRKERTIISSSFIIILCSTISSLARVRLATSLTSTSSFLLPRISSPSSTSRGGFGRPSRRFGPARVETPQARRRLASSLATVQAEPVEDEEEGPGGEELLKWERMYAQGGQRAFGVGMVQEQQQLDDGKELSFVETSEVRVVSFDLDNTLWKTSATIDAANDALAAFLDEHNIVQPKRVEKIMGELFRAEKQRYCPIDTEAAKAPVLLTTLRKDAIKKILVESNAYGVDDAEDMAAKAFECWTAARHDAIPSNLASSVEACLQQIASIRTSDGHPVIIGAITDGNSDPTLIDGLSSYFEFCVNAEKVGVSKPDKRVYLHAISEVISHPRLQGVVAAAKEAETDGSGDKEHPLKEIVGSWWVHIGDDFVKDVVAAKDLNMRSVWCRELVIDKINAAAAAAAASATAAAAKVERGYNASSSRTVEDLVKEVSEKKAIRMQVGSDDYLTDSLHREFADAIVDSFGDLGSLLSGWHDNALDASAAAAISSPEISSEPATIEDATAAAAVNADAQTHTAEVEYS